MVKQRLDKLLVDLNLCESRQRAQVLIRAGEVMVDGQILDKPGTEIKTTAQIQVKEKPPFVSRGGQKLAKALEVFGISVNGRICLDGGISTGGFTDCLLKAGAKQVYGVDVGYGQVAWSLRNDQRVVLKERTNLRYLQPAELYGVSPVPNQSQVYADLGVVDVSFISLTKILPALWQLLSPPREVVLLVKPQFEVGRDRVGKKGVVPDYSL
ncbi:MAG: TlyA family RNA methyltransferase, partial [Moorea sp. SIO3C2]|nr:TlyA family RNA methyltransferase [Moorena sp. SIO3C2]